MQTQIQLGSIAVDVLRKDIKNVHLSVHPPAGRVRIAAPTRMSLDTIRVFAIAKLPWIRKQQGKLQEQERESPREYLDRESHYVWGRRHLLKIIEVDAPPSVTASGGKLTLRIRPGVSRKKRHAIFEEWYRIQVKTASLPLIVKWEQILGVRMNRLMVRKMKTKWGSCNPDTRTILLNTELGKKSPNCLEYIIVHELAHLLVPHHGEEFLAILNRNFPHWQSHLQQLNAQPLAYTEWTY